MSLEERMMILNCIEHSMLSHAIPFTLCLFKRSPSATRELKNCILMIWCYIGIKIANTQINSQNENIGGVSMETMKKKQSKQWGCISDSETIIDEVTKEFRKLWHSKGFLFPSLYMLEPFVFLFDLDTFII